MRPQEPDCSELASVLAAGEEQTCFRIAVCQAFIFPPAVLNLARG